MGRADLLCGFLSVVALSLTIAGTRAPGNVSGDNKHVRGEKHNDAAGDSITTPASCSGVVAEPPPRDGTLAQADDAAEISRTEALPERPEEREQVVEEETAPVAATTISTIVSDEMIGSPTSALGQMGGRVSSDGVGLDKRGAKKHKQGGDQGTRREGTTAHGRWGAVRTAPSPPASRRPKATVTAVAHPEDHTHPTRFGAGTAKAKDTGPGVPRFCAALLFAAGATLCKEVGVTVFGLIAGGEVVRFLEEWDWQQQRQRRQGPRSAEPTAETHKVSREMVVRERWRCRFMTRVPLAPAMRVASAAVGAATMVVLHVRLHGGAGVREWGVLENDISVLARYVSAVNADGFALLALCIRIPSELFSTNSRKLLRGSTDVSIHSVAKLA